MNGLLCIFRHGNAGRPFLAHGTPRGHKHLIGILSTVIFGQLHLNAAHGMNVPEA